MNNMNSKLFCCVMSLIVFCHLGCTSDRADNAGGSGKEESKEVVEKKKVIVFFGNSLTAGYGLEPAESFPSLIQQKIDSAGLEYKVVNAGVSGETTSGGLGRIDWILTQPMDVFVLELGANDGLRGIPVSESKKNLQAIMDKVKEKKPDIKIILAGMQVPPNMGSSYATDFKNMFAELAANNNIPLIPFLLEGVGGIKELNLPDGIHPSAEGQKIVAKNVWAGLKDAL